MDEQSKTTNGSLLGAVIVGLGIVGLALLARSRKPIDPQPVRDPNEIARQMLQQYGPEAVHHAAQKAKALESQGKIEEAKVWRLIEDEVRRLAAPSSQPASSSQPDPVRQAWSMRPLPTISIRDTTGPYKVRF